MDFQCMVSNSHACVLDCWQNPCSQMSRFIPCNSQWQLFWAARGGDMNENWRHVLGLNVTLCCVFVAAVAPLCFLYNEPSKLYSVFREMYTRYFFRLHSISSSSSVSCFCFSLNICALLALGLFALSQAARLRFPTLQGIVSLCLQFERLLQAHLPQLFYHLRQIGAQPWVDAATAASARRSISTVVGTSWKCNVTTATSFIKCQTSWSDSSVNFHKVRHTSAWSPERHFHIDVQASHANLNCQGTFCMR